MKKITYTFPQVITYITLLFLLAVLLTSCSLPDFLSKQVPGAEAMAVEAEPEATEVSTAPAEPDPAPTEPVDTVIVPEDTIAANFDGTAESLSGLILFTSTTEDPFSAGSLVVEESDPGERYLWAVSPDGTRYGRLSPEGAGTTLVRPVDAMQNAQYVEQGITIDGEPFIGVPLPDGCADTGGDPACGNFQFTLDGSFLAYLHGPDDCGRDLTLQEVRTGQVLNNWNGVHWYYILKDGSLVINMGGCERRYVYNYAPNSARQGNLGIDGTAAWNPAHSAVLWVAQDYPMIKTALWGLNFETSRVFARMAEDQVIEDAPAWAPDGEHYLYNRRLFRVDQSSEAFALEGPRQIILMDAWTRKQKLLAYAPGYNYHICDTGSQPCTSWSGDWIQIYRTPFRRIAIRPGEMDTPEARCALYGLECETPAELFALNWSTGAIIPWDEAELADPEPALAYAPPDLEDGSPIYEDPAGEFMILASRGNRALWQVPTDGSDPRLLVADGENFIYIP